MILQGVALLRFGFQALAGGGGIAFDGGDVFLMRCEFGGFALVALV